MKRFILILSVVAFCLAQGSDKSQNGKRAEGGKGGRVQGGPWMTPGCNMTNFPKGVNGRQCCPSKPKSFNNSAAKVCKTECPKTENRTELVCCWSKCMLKQSGAINEEGKFDSAAASAKLESSTDKAAIWKPIIKPIVEKCVADAPSLVENYKKRTNRTDKCGDGLNKAIAHCVARELFIQCPTSEKNATNENCSKLFDFAKSCPAYPFFGHGGPGRNVEKSKNQQKGNADQSKSKGNNRASTGNPQGKNQGNKAADKQASKQPQGNQNKPTAQPKKN